MTKAFISKINGKIEEALKKVQEEFPFEGYLQEKRVYCDITQTVLKYLKPGAKILDFGAGPCDKTAVLSFFGFQCAAYDDLQDEWHEIGDNRKKILAFAQKFGIRYEIAGNNNLFPFKRAEFDMVMIHDVLEHLHDSPRDLLNDLLSLVKPGGYLFVTVPNAVNIRKRLAVILGKTNLPGFEEYYWSPGQWRGHIREYVKNDLIKLTDYLSLEITELRSWHRRLRVLPRFVWLLYVGLTMIFPGWRDSWLLVGKKKPDWRPKKFLPGTELKKILQKSTSYQY